MHRRILSIPLLAALGGFALLAPAGNGSRTLRVTAPPLVWVDRGTARDFDLEPYVEGGSGSAVFDARRLGERGCAGCDDPSDASPRNPDAGRIVATSAAALTETPGVIDSRAPGTAFDIRLEVEITRGSAIDPDERRRGHAQRS